MLKRARGLRAFSCCILATMCLLVAGRAFAEEALFEYLWQTNANGNDIHIIDVAKRKIVKRLVVGPNPHGIARSQQGGVIYLTLESDGKKNGELLWINPTDAKIMHRMQVGLQPHNPAVSVDGKWIYVPMRDKHYWVIDTATKSVVKKIHTGGRPHNTTASPDGRYMFLSPLSVPGTVTIVDIEAGHREVGTIHYSAAPRPPALSSNGQFLFQHVDDLNGFEVANTRTRKLLARVEHGKEFDWNNFSRNDRWYKILREKFNLGLSDYQHCHGLAIHPDQAEIWSCCAQWLTIHSTIKPGYPELGSISLAGSAYWITFSSQGKYAFVAIVDRNRVAMIDTKSREVVKYFEVGSRPKRNFLVELPEPMRLDKVDLDTW